jgi:hypothetical protein
MWKNRRMKGEALWCMLYDVQLLMLWLCLSSRLNIVGSGSGEMMALVEE